jgi:hypothetical protein
MRRNATVALTVSVVLVLSAGTAAATRWPDIWVAVTGPAGSEAREGLVLEVGATAWDGYGGVVAVPSDTPVAVRLVGRASCRTYASFVAPPGTSWVIRFAADGSARIEDRTGRPMDAGPGLGERPPTGCPIGTAARPSESGDGATALWTQPALLIGLAALIITALIAFATSRTRRS